MSQAISSIENLEQEVTAIINEAGAQIDFDLLSHDYQKLITEYVEIKGLLKIVETERNTLSQAMRILASYGEIDPVLETVKAQEEMKDGHA